MCVFYLCDFTPKTTKQLYLPGAHLVHAIEIRCFARCCVSVLRAFLRVWMKIASIIAHQEMKKYKDYQTILGSYTAARGCILTSDVFGTCLGMVGYVSTALDFPG